MGEEKSSKEHDYDCPTCKAQKEQKEQKEQKDYLVNIQQGAFNFDLVNFDRGKTL